MSHTTDPIRFSVPLRNQADKKKKLGRGLGALMGETRREEPVTRSPEEDDDRKGREPATAHDTGLAMLAVAAVEPMPGQPRRRFDEQALDELAASIASRGVIQPVIVRPLAGGRYQLVAGERRWRAAQKARLHEIPALVRKLEEGEVMALALIENIQREDLNPLEEATALERLTSEFGMTHQAVADAVGRSRASVSNLLRLLDLAPETKALIAERRIEMGHARALASLERVHQAAVAREVADKQPSVPETVSLVRRLLSDEPRRGPAPPDPNINRLQQDLTSRIGASVRIQHGRSGKGRLVIQYNSLDELDGILDHIR